MFFKRAVSLCGSLASSPLKNGLNTPTSTCCSFSKAARPQAINVFPTPLTRYVGDDNQFREVYEVKKQQLEAAYKKQQQEISELKDFVARQPWQKYSRRRPLYAVSRL